MAAHTLTREQHRLADRLLEAIHPPEIVEDVAYDVCVDLVKTLSEAQMGRLIELVEVGAMPRRNEKLLNERFGQVTRG